MNLVLCAPIVLPNVIANTMVPIVEGTQKECFLLYSELLVDLTVGKVEQMIIVVFMI